MDFEQFQEHCKTEQRRYIEGERRRMEQAMKAWNAFKSAMQELGLHPLTSIEIENRCDELGRMEARIDADFADGPTMRFSFDQFAKKATDITKWIIINTRTGEAAKLTQLGKIERWTSASEATQFQSKEAARHVCDWLESEGVRNIDFDAI
jgi:hypothetical protein